MLHNTMSSILNLGSLNASAAGGDGGTIQETESAGRLIDKFLNQDSCFPTLLEMLKLPPQGGASVSGLSENDYPSGGDSRILRHLHTLRKVSLPADLLHHFQHMQCNCMMGLFPEIKRAWLTIDSDIYVWVYEDGSDLAYFDGLHDTILGVGLVSPKTGVFKSYIKHLLCLTTLTEVILLGVSFSFPGENEAIPTMHLLPEPLFSVSTDGAYLLTIQGTKDGRIFLGAKDGSLWELVYQAEDGWFTRKCYKVNHSRSAVSYILPSFLTLSEDDPVTQVEVDDSRHLVYTLTEKGNVSVYDLGADGKSTSRVVTLSHNTITNTAVQVAKTIDKTNFKNLVSICPVETRESPHIHLIIITDTGVRLYYTTSPLNAPHCRPNQMTLLHIRLPPGFAANALTHRPTRVHKALYSRGTGILCASESIESDVIWTVSSDQYPYHPTLAESQAVLSVDGYVWAIADVTQPLWCSALNPPTLQGTSPPLLVTQHQQSPRQLVLLSASGAHILTTLRPVDQLKYLLQECGSADAAVIKEFFIAMTLTQACATALVLALDLNLQESQVAEWARDAIFRYGSVIPSSVQFPSYQTIQSPGGYAFQPTQVSTPVQNQSLVQMSQQQQQSSMGDQQYSALHNSLYLFLARILRPVWATQLAKEENRDNKPVLVSVVSSEEVGFLARHVECMAKFMYANQGPGQAVCTPTSHNLNNTPNQTARLNGYMSDGSIGERSSLLALRALLTQCLEVLRLWTVLTTHNFTLIAEGLSKDVKDQTRNVTLRDLVLNGKDICRSLIMALMDRYHGDNSSIDAISSRLRDTCPSLYRVEDAKLSKANEIILAAKNNNNKSEKEKAFREAVELCKQIGQSVNVSGICNQLASGSWYEGVVDLCLSVATQRDQTGQALHYYKNKINEPNEDPQGFMAFSARMDCYGVMMNHINQLIGSSVMTAPITPSIPNRPGPPSSPQQEIPSSDAGHYADQMITLIINSSDELAHVTLYQWLIATGRTDRLLAINAPYLENFLTKSDSQGPLNNLLWRYYEKNREYYKAAKTLSLLADQAGDTPLNVRVEYLSRALMCLSSSQMTTATSYADLMLHLEEKKDVARVQLMILEAIQARSGPSDIISSLNAGLLDITTLYEKYAEPWQLWECKLAIVHCAGHSEPQLIRVLWTNIIDNELKKSEGSPTASRIDSLSAKIKTLGRIYATSPNYFPLEHIIKICELRSVQMKEENTSWFANTLQSCGIPVSKLIAIYHRLYVTGDSIWEVERATYHLLRVLANLFSTLTDTNLALSPQEKRALREECLDYIAAYLTDLGASADPSAAVTSSHLKACQTRLEKSF